MEPEQIQSRDFKTCEIETKSRFGLWAAWKLTLCILRARHGEGSKLLCDAARLVGSDVGAPQRVQQRRLTVVNMTYNLTHTIYYHRHVRRLW